MTEFNVGDVVYIKDNVIEYAKQAGVIALAPGQSYPQQLGLAKDIPFTIIYIEYYGSCHLTNFNDSWGIYHGCSFKGKKYKTWCLSPDILEKRIDLNTISLFELNRGL